MTVIYYTYFDENIADELFESRIGSLPLHMRSKIKKFRKKQDALASLYGKLLLQEGFLRFDISATLDDLKYTRHKKPYLSNSSISFNISHSGNYVVCAMSNEVNTLGVDVEEIQKIDTNDFRNIWTEKEQELISENNLNMFYTLWTRKEAIIKADGRGMELPLKEIDVINTEVALDNQLYFLKTFNIHVNYALNLASHKNFDKVDLVHITF